MTDEGGVKRLLDQIPIRLKESDLDRLAVILGADKTRRIAGFNFATGFVTRDSPVCRIFRRPRAPSLTSITSLAT